jgi:hypothetical protein
MIKQSGTFDSLGEPELGSGIGHYCEVTHRVSTELFFPQGAAVNRKDQKQLQDIRRSHAETANPDRAAREKTRPSRCGT